MSYSKMKLIFFQTYFLLLVNIIVASQSGDNVLRTQLIQGRIVAGQDATANQFPYQVFMKVQYDKHNGATCGGVLIGKNWVLTIAKCTQNVTNATLYLGSNERNSFPVVISVQENEIFPHPDYNPKYHNNDIGLIRIPPLTLNDTVNIIRLPYMGTTNTYADQYAYAVGWGDTNSANNPQVLQYAAFEVMTNARCAAIYGSLVVTAGTMCIRTTDGISPCYGDAGGPLVLEHENILIGLQSFQATGGDSCYAGYPSGLVRVSYYLDWIKNITGIVYYDYCTCKN
ncbi:collagenase-like [Teleopsis dalmanni]|uniref:collagenase-like n=1 Tax=Teleopsis dalmanni TaxID=139649 RepID=UPI0018CCFDEE|nr:collagenase-like [Teleopsis dalmanni]